MNESSEFFSHGLLAKKIAEIFSEQKVNSSFVIAINGSWGTGKTNLMNNVLSVLEEQSYIKVNFNAWRFAKKEEIWRALLVCILDSCREYVCKEKNQKYLGWKNKDINIILRLLDDTERALYTAFIKEIPGEICINASNLLKTGLDMALKFVPWGNFGSEFINALFLKKEADEQEDSTIIDKEDMEKLWGVFNRSSTKKYIEQITGIEQFRRTFEVLIKALLEGDYNCHVSKQKLTKHNKNIKLIVSIDDVDRCLPENTLEILEAIKLFLDYSGTFFMIAMDGDVIQQGLNMRYNQYEFAKIRAKDYYEKMIDLSFDIPALLEDNFYLYIKSLSEYGDEYIKLFNLLFIALKLNLRAWKRYIYRADFNRGILKELTNEDIFGDENILNAFLKLQCFSYQWPEFYRKINDYETYVELECRVHEIVDYESKCLEKILVELDSLLICKEILSDISDKRILDFLRAEPRVSQIQKKEIINIAFTFDKIMV